MREVKWTLQRAKPEIKVFYNDLRFFGQEFYLEKLYRDAGVTFVRANSRYFDEDETGVNVRYYAGGELHEETVRLRGPRHRASAECRSLKRLSALFGFSLNEYGFVKEAEPLTTDADDVYVSGGALEPMNIKDSILTGFGAGMLALRGADSRLKWSSTMIDFTKSPNLRLQSPTRAPPSFSTSERRTGASVFYEYISSKFIALAHDLKKKGKTVYVVTRNMVTPSYAELAYEEARREGMIFIHLEEGEGSPSMRARRASQVGQGNSPWPWTQSSGPRTIAPFFKEKEFLSLYRSEPQLRWSPTKWGRKTVPRRFHQAPQGRAMGAERDPWRLGRDAPR